MIFVTLGGQPPGKFGLIECERRARFSDLLFLTFLECKSRPKWL